MSVLGTVIVGIVILIGVIGAVVQIWPSAPVVGGAILVWSWMTGTRAAWIIFAIVALVLILGTVLKYVIPARGMNKADGLQELIDQLGIARGEVASFGDNYNDVEMLKLAGTAVAMGNAVDEVKALADYVTTSSDQDGIAHALAHLGCI